MISLVTTMKYIFTISNAAMISTIVYFMDGLRWEEEHDHASIIGFTWMLITIAGSVVLIWI